MSEAERWIRQLSSRNERESAAAEEALHNLGEEGLEAALQQAAGFRQRRMRRLTINYNFCQAGVATAGVGIALGIAKLLHWGDTATLLLMMPVAVASILLFAKVAIWKMVFPQSERNLSR